MGKIIKLDKNLSNQISAGEVVERPLCVVKELIENSIDAKAKNIKIIIQNGGKKEITIVDDGTGIDKDDLQICLEKYTTSKIKSLKDLYNVMTFGFRGEALSAISSISKITIISKTDDSETTNKLYYDNDNGQQMSITNGNTGTTITVEDLFYNTPARLNYLKQDRTEYSKILEYVEKVSLSYPDIGFELISDGRQVLKYSQNETLKTRIYNIYGEEFYNCLVDIDFKMTGIKVSGFISNPKTNFANKNKQALFVNSRPIQSPIIFKAIKDAYNRFIPHNTFPGYVLNIFLDPTLVDVNVHPRKQEVRFALESDIFRAVYHSILDKLEKSTIIDLSEYQTNTSHNVEINNFSNPINSYSKGFTQSENTYNNSGGNSFSNSSFPSYSKNDLSNSINFTRQVLSTTDIETDENVFNMTKDLHYTKVGKIVGQMLDSYIIVENDPNIYIFDQHALAERVIYEKLLTNTNNSLSQKLLIPENLTLQTVEYEIYLTYKNVLNQMGFDLEELSGNTISIYSIPDFIKNKDIKSIFLGILEDIKSGNLDKSVSLEEIQNIIYSYVACRAAIKFGDRLSLFEINHLLNEGAEIYSSTCPHGRPSVYKMSKNELNLKFLR